MIMEQIVADRAGNRLKTLRLAIGLTRPQMESELQLKKGRIHNLEALNNRLNEEDFSAIGSRYPWALLYIACGGELVIPGDIDAPAQAVGKLSAQSSAAPASLDPADLMQALTNDPELKAAFQQMMIETLKAGLGGDSK